MRQMSSIPEKYLPVSAVSGKQFPDTLIAIDPGISTGIAVASFAQVRSGTTQMGLHLLATLTVEEVLSMIRTLFPGGFVIYENGPTETNPMLTMLEQQLEIMQYPCLSVMAGNWKPFCKAQYPFIQPCWKTPHEHDALMLLIYSRTIPDERFHIPVWKVDISSKKKK